VAVGIDQPGTDVFFRMPGYPRRDRALIQAARRLQGMRTAEQAFVDHSLPEGFIGRLNEAVENLRQAINNQTVARTALSALLLSCQKRSMILTIATYRDSERF